MRIVESSGACCAVVLHAKAIRIRLLKSLKCTGIHKVQKGLRRHRTFNWSGGAQVMSLKRCKEECPVAIDRPAHRSAKLIAYELIVQPVEVRKPVFRRQCLNPVVLKQRP